MMDLELRLSVRGAGGPGGSLEATSPLKLSYAPTTRSHLPTALSPPAGSLPLPLHGGAGEAHGSVPHHHPWAGNGEHNQQSRKRPKKEVAADRRGAGMGVPAATAAEGPLGGELAHSQSLPLPSPSPSPRLPQPAGLLHAATLPYLQQPLSPHASHPWAVTTPPAAALDVSRPQHPVSLLPPLDPRHPAAAMAVGACVEGDHREAPGIPSTGLESALDYNLSRVGAAAASLGASLGGSLGGSLGQLAIPRLGSVPGERDGDDKGGAGKKPLPPKKRDWVLPDSLQGCFGTPAAHPPQPQPQPQLQPQHQHQHQLQYQHQQQRQHDYQQQRQHDYHQQQHEYQQQNQYQHQQQYQQQQQYQHQQQHQGACSSPLREGPAQGKEGSSPDDTAPALPPLRSCSANNEGTPSGDDCSEEQPLAAQAPPGARERGGKGGGPRKHRNRGEGAPPSASNGGRPGGAKGGRPRGGVGQEVGDGAPGPVGSKGSRKGSYHRFGTDGFCWTKYSHKRLRNTKTERSYYACVEKDRLACPARKLVDRPQKLFALGDYSCDIVTLEGTHNHPPVGAPENPSTRVSPSLGER